MSKVKMYVRVAKNGGRFQIAANVKPQSGPLMDSNRHPLPTVAFALVLGIDDSEFKKAEKVLAEIDVPSGDVRVCADVQQG